MLLTLKKSSVGPLTIQTAHDGSVAVTEDHIFTDRIQRQTTLRAPILVGCSTRLAKQIMVPDARLPIRFFLRDLKTQGD